MPLQDVISEPVPAAAPAAMPAVAPPPEPPATLDDSDTVDPSDTVDMPAVVATAPAPDAAARASTSGAARAGAGRTRTLRQLIAAARPPLWTVPVVVFVLLTTLTLALWRAETSLEALHAAANRRGSNWVLWGGLSASLMTAVFAYLALLQRSRDYEQTRRHVRALESLQAVSSALIARVDAGTGALSELCESAQHLLGADRAGILLFDRDAGRLEMLAYSGDMPKSPPRYYELSDLPNVKWCLDAGQMLFAEDVRRLDHAQNEKMLALFRVRSMALIPLLIQGEQIGMLTVSTSEPRGYTDLDKRLAELLGSQAAVILANTRLYQAQQSAVQKYKALLDQRELLFSTNASIYQTGDLDESLRRIAELAPIALGADLCIVALSARPPDNVRVAAITPGARSRGLRVGTSFYCPAAERAFQRGAVCVFPKADDPDVALVRDAFPEMGSMACVPLSGRDGARIGVLALVRRQAGVFNAEQLKMARMFATRAAAAIENARLYQETRRALEEQKKLLAQRDTLWAVNAAVYRAGTLDDSLDRIARLAPRALNVDICGVHLTTGREGEIYLAAITDDVGREMVGRPTDVRGLNAGKVLETRQPLVVEDARSDAGIAPGFLARFKLGSVAYFPLLRNDGQVLGLIVLSRHQPGPFDKAQVELARVFSTRAASAIENAQLLEQTRRDADTKAMLLRELNHRVKNNLAGIVALLTMGQPEMPPAARRWLDRVTDRVRVLAGAHQLFVGDAGSVPLAQLVERMVSSLAVARSPGVEMRVELGAAPAVELRTEQAISLAMALHELCYNAIVHGLEGSAGGTVTLRTREAGPGWLAVDVIDNGRGVDGLDAGSDTGEHDDGGAGGHAGEAGEAASG
jgi:GAF domain-containing protein